MSTKNKNTYLSIRISQKDKAKIEKEAKNLDMKISEYVRKACLDSKVKRNIRLQLVSVTTILQEVSNYIKINYNGDKFIEGAVKKLWDNLL